MFGKQTGTIRKGLALITGFMLILTQLALPVAALAAADLSMLPQALTITYTDAAGVPGSLMTAPGAAGETADTAVYWGQVTDPSLAWPLTVSIDPGSPLCVVNYTAPVDEYSGLAQGNAAMADGMSYVATLSVFADPEHTSWVGDYPVYLSSLPVGSIVVSYLNQADNAELYSYTLVNLPPASYTIGPDQAGMVGEGYALTDGTPQSVYINADGSPVYVTFTMTPIGQDIPEGGAGDLPPEGIPGDTYPEGGQEGPVDWGGEEDTPSGGGQDDPADWGGEEDVPDPQPVIDEPIGNDTPETPYNLNDTPGLVQSDNGGSVNLRQLPDKNSTALGKVASGTLVTLHGITEDNGWYYMNCETDQGRIDGYMVSSFVRPVVVFSYADENGNPLTNGQGAGQTYQTLGDGTYSDFSDIAAGAGLDGYAYIGANPAQITVTGGAADIAYVSLMFRQAATAATVTFLYTDVEGGPIADGSGNTSQEVSIDNGVYGYDQIMSYAPNIPGYTVQGANAEQLAVENGAANPAAIAFTYKANPTAATVTFLYTDPEGSPIADGSGNTSQEVSVGNGVYGYDQIMPYAPNIPGYVAQGANAERLVVENGAADPAVIAFAYKAIPAAATVTFLYTDDNGTPVADQEGHTQREQSLPNGTYEDLTSFIPAIPGYTFLSASAQKITVTDGVADPPSVTIAYKANPTPAAVTFSFVDDKGKTLRPDVPAQLDATISDLTEYIAQIDGYTYQSASAAQIVVTKGAAEPNHVTFTYKQNATTAQVEIRYLDQIGRQIGNSEYKELTPGTHTISPTIPAGYSLSGGSPATQSVTVSPALVATPNQINFNLVSNSVRGTVLVRYLNTDGGTIVASQNQSLAPGTHTLFPDAAALPAAYEIITSISQSATVTISDQGVSTPAQVDFYCKAKQSTDYVGYAVTTGQTALRKAYDMSDGSIIATLPANTLLYINGQATVSNILWDSAKTVVGTIRAGVVQDSATRHISSEEAKAIIDEYNRLNPVNTPVPAQSTGYYITVAANVPLRTYADANSSATYLPLDTVVYVTGQQYINSVGWHMASYNGRGGYIRVDQQLRKMSAAEVERYLAGLKTNTPSTGPTVAPYDPYGPSTYGYVTSGSVNFRQTPSTNGAKLKTLQRYAFALIIGTKEVNGVTWYYINQSGTTGWVHGGYFHQLNLTELSSFLNSSEYRQGLVNNSTANNTNTNNTTNNSGSSNQSTSGNNSTGSATAGNISSVEDWNVGTWQNTGVTTQTSYAPFNPYATATPSATVSASPSASVEPEETFVIGTMIPITYEDESTETQTNAAPWGLIAAGVVLIGGAGGVYAYALNQNKKRKAAAAARAAAQRRSAMAQGDPQSPYTRRAAVVPPVSGTRKDAQQPIVPGGANQNGAPYGRTPGSGTAAQNPYASSAAKNPFSSGSITGTGDGFTPRQSNPYAAPVSQPDSDREGAGQNAYRPQGAPSGVPGQSAAPQRSNPYARPIQPASPAQSARPAGADDGTAAPRRRASRMERYHAADEGGRDDTK